MSSIEIRVVKLEDAETLSDLSCRTFYDTYAWFNTKENMNKFMAENFSVDSIKTQISNPENVFMIAYLDNEAVGYAKIRESKYQEGIGKEESIEIERIYADKKFIGKGIGRSLILKSMEIAKDKGKKIVWLGVWEHNHNAIGFYKKMGFEQFGKHVFMLGDDAQTDFLMKIAL